MRRLLLALVAVVGMLSLASPAVAWHHCGWGGYGGWGGCYRGGWCGYGGYCGYRPFYSVGYFPAYGGYYGGIGYPYYYGGYGYPYSYSRVGIGYGVPLGVGYYSYQPSTSLVVTASPAVSQAARQGAKPAINGNVVKNGPAAVQQFLGLANLQPVMVAKRAAPHDQALARFSNPETRRKAERLIAEGDTLFRAQNFNSALQKYKLAASLAPDIAEAYWRQGHALVAVNQFESATTAFKRAIALTDELGRGGFRLDDLYGGASLTKSAHVESLAEYAMSLRNSPDPYFLLGVFLTYDGQAERATKFFERAADLAGISGGHIAVFLAPVKEAPVANPAPPAASAEVPVVKVSVGREI